MLRKFVFTALTLSFLGGGPLWAQPANGGSPRDVLTALAAWLSSVLPDAVDINDLSRNLDLKRQGDHYALFIGVGSKIGMERVPPDATAIIRRSVGRWLIDDIRLPAQSEICCSVRTSVGDQAGSFVIDDTATTASMGTLALSQLAMQVEDDGEITFVEIGRTLLSTIVRPLFDTRADVYVDNRIENFALDVKGKHAAPAKLAFGSSRVTLSVEGVTRKSLSNLVLARDTLGNVGEALADVASGMAFGSQFEDLAFVLDGTTGSLRSGEIVVEAEKQNGMLQASLMLNAQTIAMRNAKIDPYADFVPTRVTLRPSVSHVPLDALIRLAAIGGGRTPADLQAIFADGGVQAGLDSLVVDVAGTEFTGSGKMLFTGPTAFSGSGTITTENLDALQQRLAADPALAKALPVLIFIKGVGRLANNTMVWDVTYHDHRLFVNNQDLTSMLGIATGGTPAPVAKPPVPPTPAPQPPRPGLRRQ